METVYLDMGLRKKYIQIRKIFFFNGSLRINRFIQNLRLDLYFYVLTTENALQSSNLSYPLNFLLL